MTGVGQVLFNFAIRTLLVVFPVVWWFEVPVQLGTVMHHSACTRYHLLGTMIGLLADSVGMLYQDVGRVWGLVPRRCSSSRRHLSVPKNVLGRPVGKSKSGYPFATTTRNWLVNGEVLYLPGFVWVSLAVSLVLYSRLDDVPHSDATPNLSDERLSDHE